MGELKSMTPFTTFALTVLLIASSAQARLDQGVYTSTEPSTWTLFDSGPEALSERLKLIESAQVSIEMEYFIYRFAQDSSSWLITQALIQKAQQGVKVRLLLDGLPFVLEMSPFLSELFLQKGIEVRFYNRGFSIANLQKANHRNHRKTLIIDGKEFMTGGRNIGDEYFHLSPKLNFIDFDVHISGAVAKAAQESFENFWNSELSQEPPSYKVLTPQSYGYNSEQEFKADTRGGSIVQKSYEEYLRNKRFVADQRSKAKAFMSDNQQNRNLLRNDIKAIEPNFMRKTFVCNDSEFHTDIPGYKNNPRFMKQAMQKFISSAKTSLKIETPYLIVRENEGILKPLIRPEIDVQILTNSLATSDNTPAVAGSLRRARSLLKNNVSIFIARSVPPETATQLSQDSQSSVWGLHAKNIIVDDSRVLISTFNIDPRSFNINTEMGVICNDGPELAQYMKNRFEEIKANTESLDLKDMNGPAGDKYLTQDLGKRLLLYLLTPLAWLSEGLL